MKITTSRFGLVEFAIEDQIGFKEGILGFSNLNSFILVDDPEDEIFAWLQSCNEPQIAFPILEPELFLENYKPRLTKSDLEMLALKSSEGTRNFVIVTIPEDPTKMTANLKAPIIINVKERTGRQCVLQDNDLNIREPIFTKLQQKLIQSPQNEVKAANNSDLMIRVKAQPTEPEAKL